MDARPSNATAESPATTKKRRRPALACAQCRRRKIRCDQGFPCENCLKVGIRDCTIPPNHISTLRVQQAEAARSVSSTVPPPPPSAPASSVLTPRPTPKSASPGDSNVEGLLAKIEDLERTISVLRRGNGEAQGPGDVPTPAERPSHFGNQSAWLNKTSLSARILSHLKELREQRPDFRQSIASCQNLLGQINNQLTVDLTADNYDTTMSTSGTQIPGRTVADELLDLYFQTFEGLFRILHVPSFLAEYERYWQQPSEAPRIFILQLQLCLGLGSKIHADSMHFRRVSSLWLLEAETWLGMSFRKSRQRRTTFEDLQLMCLALITRADMPGSEKFSWTGAGDLLRVAMCLNLHRDPKNLGDVAFRQAELHRRLWMTILELNLLFSLQAGQAPLVTPQDYSTLPPADLSDEELDHPRESRAQDLTHHATRTTAQLAFFESFELRLQTIRRINGIRPVCSYDETIRLHKDLTKAEAKMNQKLALYSEENSVVSERSFRSSTQKLFVKTTFSYYLLALHLPVLGLYIQDPTRHFSRKVATTIASKMVEVFSMDNASIQSSQSLTGGSQADMLNLNRLFTNSPGLFRNIAMQAVFYLTLEYVTMREDKAGDIGLFLEREEMDLLQLLSRSQAWLVDRVKRGMKDVYSCCFVAASISYAQSLSFSGASRELVDERIAEKALEQSEECRRNLESLAHSLGAVSREQVPLVDSRVGFSQHYLSSGEVSVDWMTDMDLEGIAASGYYDWSLHGGVGSAPHYLL